MNLLPSPNTFFELIRLLLSSVLVFSFLIFINGCNKRDLTPPSIDLTSPIANANFRATDKIDVTGRATDESGSVSITLQLESPLTGQIYASNTGGPDQQGEFSIDLTLGDRYTPAETYILRATAFDPAGNKASDFINLNLSELPFQYYRTIFGTSGLNNLHQIYAIDTFNQVNPGPILNERLMAMTMDNRSQQLVAALADGSMTSYAPTDFSIFFNLDVGNGSPDPNDWPNPHLQWYQNQFYLGTTQAPYLRRYTKDGILENTYGVNFPVMDFTTGNDGIYVGMSSPNGNTKKIDHFDRTLGQLRSSRTLAWLPRVVFRPSTDQILVGGEESNQGRLLVLAVTDLGQELGSISLTDPVKGIFGTANKTWVRQTSRISTYLPSSVSMGLPILIDDFTAAAWDEQRQELWTGKEDLIQVFSGTGSLLRTYPGNFGVVTHFDFHYNK